MDLKELKKLIEQVQAEKKQKIINENWSEFDDSEERNTGSSIHQDAVDILKFFATEYPTKPLTGLSFYKEHMQNIISFAQDYKKSQGISTNTPEEQLKAIRKMSNVKVQDYIRKLLTKMGLVDEAIAAIDNALDAAIAKTAEAEKDVLSQKSPTPSVSPTGSTVLRPSGIPATNPTNAGSPAAAERRKAREAEIEAARRKATGSPTQP